MNYEAQKNFILKKLAQHIRVAEQYDEAPESPTQLFDDFEKTNQLSDLKDLLDITRNLDGEMFEIRKSLIEQMKVIETLLDHYSGELAKNSLANKIDLNRVEDRKFIKIARAFEKAHKKSLVVTVPTPFY